MLLSFCLFFCQFQPGIAYKSVAYKKKHVPKIDEIRFIAKQSNAPILGISESRLDSSILSSEVDIEHYDVVRMDRLRRKGRVACCSRKSLFFMTSQVFVLTLKAFLQAFFLLKSKPILVGLLHRPPDKPEFIEYLDNSKK